MNLIEEEWLIYRRQTLDETLKDDEHTISLLKIVFFNGTQALLRIATKLGHGVEIGLVTDDQCRIAMGEIHREVEEYFKQRAREAENE